MQARCDTMDDLGTGNARSRVRRVVVAQADTDPGALLAALLLI
jgi:hypothetical protein